MAILDNVPYYSRVKAKVKAWFEPEKLDVEQLRGALMGTMITASLGEVAVYKMLRQNASLGDLPSCITDIFIITISLLEALSSPFIAWYGSRDRRRVLLATMVAMVVVALTWFALPVINIPNPEIEQYTRMFTFSRLSSNTLIRLLIFTVSCIVFSVTRVTAFTHGITHLYQHDPDKISLHFGIIVIARVLPLLLGEKLGSGGLDENNESNTGFLIGSMINLYQIATALPNKAGNTDTNTKKNKTKSEQEIKKNKGGNEEEKPLKDASEGDATGENKSQLNKETKEKIGTGNEDLKGQQVETDLRSSLKRVLTNKFLVYQMVCMGLLTAALWRFSFCHDEIVKIKYFIDPKQILNHNITDMFRYHFLAITVLYTATFFYPPITSTDLVKKAKKTSVIASAVACAMYILMVFSDDCPKGVVASVDYDSNNNMNCGIGGCTTPSWSDFSPVCVPDTLTTFLTAHDAGCNHAEEVNGITYFLNCLQSATSPFAIATVGACSDPVCRPAYEFHLMLFFFTVTATIISLQCRGILVLRTGEPRDLSVKLGVLLLVVTGITFGLSELFHGIGHAIFNSWVEFEHYSLHSKEYLYLLAGTSTAMVFLLVVLTLVAWRSGDWNEKESEEGKMSSEKKIN